MYLVRFFKVGGHLGQELVGGDPHIDSKTQLLTDRILDQGSGLQWGAEEAGGAAGAEEAGAEEAAPPQPAKRAAQSAKIKTRENSCFISSPPW